MAPRALDPATLRLRGHFFGGSYAVAGLLDAVRLSLRLWRTLRKLKRNQEAKRVERELRAAVQRPAMDPGLEHKIGVSDRTSAALRGVSARLSSVPGGTFPVGPPPL